MIAQPTKTPSKNYSKKDMRLMYDVSAHTWKSWEKLLLKELKKIGYRPNQKIYTPAQSELLFNKLGRP